MDIVTAHPSAVVLFCGKVFDSLLAPFVVARKDFSFRLGKADCAATAMISTPLITTRTSTNSS
jgi:hypothetical protein